MKNTILFFLLLYVSLFAFAQPSKVLFIGNSYTYVNNLPELVSTMMSSMGEGIEYEMSAPGGCTFQQHCTVSSSYIQQGNWDYVVLQEQSQLPSFPEEQFMQDCYPYAASLCSMTQEYNTDARVVFYMTWGRKNGDQQNCPYYPPLCTYQGMDSLLHLRYIRMAEDNHAWVSPVGAAWHYIRDHYPTAELYQSDESHPSYLGSYVAACCFYTVFTGLNPCQIIWNGLLDDATASMAKNVAKTVVFDSLWKWTFQSEPIPEDSTAVVDFLLLEKGITIYPNPVSNTLHFSVPELVNSPMVCILNVDGRVVYSQQGFSSWKENQNQFDLDVSFLNSGIYFLSVNTGSYKSTKKFTIFR